MTDRITDRLLDLAADESGWPTYMAALPEIAAVIEAAGKVDRWHPQTEFVLGRLHPQHLEAVLAVRWSLAALAARLIPPVDEEATLAALGEARDDKGSDLLPCYCHGDDLVPYCPKHTPLPGEARDD